MEELLTITQAAEILGVSAGTLREWEKKGVLDAIRTDGKHRRYSKRYVENFRDKGPPKSNYKWWFLKLFDSIEQNRKQIALGKYGAFLNLFDLKKGDWEPEDIAMIIENSINCQQLMEDAEPCSTLELVEQIRKILEYTILGKIVRVGSAHTLGFLKSYQRIRNSGKVEDGCEEINVKTLYLNDEDEKDVSQYKHLNSNISQYIENSSNKIDKLLRLIEIEVMGDLACNAGTIATLENWVDRDIILNKIKNVFDMIDKKISWKLPKWAVLDPATFNLLSGGVCCYIDKYHYFFNKELNCNFYKRESLQPSIIIMGCEPHRKFYGYSFDFYLPLLSFETNRGNGVEPVSVYGKKLMREGSQFFGTISDRELKYNW